MFGKPQWFRPKTFGWGLTPVTWQGWVYTLIWCGLLIGPFNLLLIRGQSGEAIVWLFAAIGLLIWDVRTILVTMAPDGG